MPRRALIDDHLRAHDPLGLAAGEHAARIAAAGSSPTHRRRRPRLVPMLAGGGLVATALVLALVLLLAGAPGDRAPGLLSPQAAVAAAAQTLDGDGILHWVTVADPAEQNRADHRRGVLSDGRTETWVDLETLASHMVYPTQKPGGPGARPEETWYNGQRSFWVRWPAWAFRRGDGRQLVMRTVRRRGEKILITKSPIDKLRETLDLARSGKATLRAMPPEQGVPVVRIRESGTNGPYKWATMTWITREAQPRLLRRVDQIRRRGHPTTTNTTATQTWEILPRSAAALADVRVPHFDPAKVAVRTQFLGPPKR